MRPSTPLIKDVAVTLALAAVAAACLYAAGLVVDMGPASSGPPSHREQVREVRDRTILSSNEEDAGTSRIVRYTYLGERLPERLADDEVTALRSETSWTRQTGTAPDGRAEYESIVFTKPQFVNYEGAWHYVEYGSAPAAVFREAQKPSLFSGLFAQVAHALTGTTYTGLGDGLVTSYSPISWADAQGTSSPSYIYLGNGTSVAGLQITPRSMHHTNSGKFDLTVTGYYINRVFLPFDTSFVPFGATILSGSLNMHATGTPSNTDNDGLDYLTVVQTSQASHYELVMDDFDQAGAIDNPTEGIDAGQRKDITSITGGSTVTWTLNATGRGWIKKNGEASSCGASTNYIFLTSGTTWTVPHDWSPSDNSIEVIGGGANGRVGTSTTGANGGGPGGGGGAYSKVTNVALPAGQTIAMQVGTGGTFDGLSEPPSPATDTYLCNSLSNCTSITDSAVIVGAKAGTMGTHPGAGTAQGGGGQGGQASAGVGTTKYSGGNGGDRNVNAGGGGGGAAGPNGNGANGGAGGTVAPRGGGGGGGHGGGAAGAQGTSSGGAGGTNYLGAGGGTGGTGGSGGVGGNGSNGGGGGGGGGIVSGSAGNGGTGGMGTEWDSAHGTGGGGGGGGASTNNGNGVGGATAGYGGGGGGGGGDSGTGNDGTANGGGPGLIVIRYANIGKGTTCLGVREGHDATDSAITTDTDNYVAFASSETAGTTYDPYLSITYLAPFAFWQFQDF